MHRPFELNGRVRSTYEAIERSLALGGDGATSLQLAAELHGDELQPDEVELFHGCLDYAPDYIETRRRLFPHAVTGPISTEGAPMQGDRIAVLYCPSCRMAES